MGESARNEGCDFQIPLMRTSMAREVPWEIYERVFSHDWVRQN